MVQDNIQTLVKVTVNSRGFGRSKTQENTEGLACSLSSLTSAFLFFFIQVLDYALRGFRDILFHQTVKK